MKTLVFPAMAAGFVSLAGLSALAFPGSPPATDPALHRAGSSDGAGLPGLPGGRGGKSGRDLAREDRQERGRSSAVAGDPALTDYCIAMLKTNGRDGGDDDYRPSDCADYFIGLEAGRTGRRGADAGGVGGKGGKARDGASIDGGVGGQGGRSGAGPGGGRGGAGGAGVGGGAGGRGGAGGAGY